MHHSRDGFYFLRRPDGAVRIIFGRPVVRPDGLSIDGIAAIGQTELPENEWASAVAFVSEKGENAETYQAARELHAGQDSQG